MKIIKFIISILFVVVFSAPACAVLMVGTFIYYHIHLGIKAGKYVGNFYVEWLNDELN
jgi:hypothetical protein